MRGNLIAHWTRTQPGARMSRVAPEAEVTGGLVLTGKAAVLKTAGLIPLGVRIPRPPPESERHTFGGEVAEWLKAAAC